MKKLLGPTLWGLFTAIVMYVIWFWLPPEPSSARETAIGTAFIVFGFVLNFLGQLWVQSLRKTKEDSVFDSEVYNKNFTFEEPDIIYETKDDQPCEALFQRLARNDPDKLATMIATNTTMSIGLRAIAVECLGEADDPNFIVREAGKYLKSEHPIIREASVYALERAGAAGRQLIREALPHERSKGVLEAMEDAFEPDDPDPRVSMGSDPITKLALESIKERENVTKA